MKNIFKCLLFVFTYVFLNSTVLFAQRSGEILGTVKDRKTQEPLIGVTIKAEGTTTGAITDVDGKFKLVLPTGSYNLVSSYVGYKSLTKYNIIVVTGNAQQINFELDEDATILDEVQVVVNRSISVASAENPNSIQKLTAEEIKNNPGGNFDISRVIGVLPGVGGTAGNGSFRNDLLIRGGGPSENVFYLDGIEIPVINHFATQGSSGGPQGILNVAFIEDATLSTSSFNAKYDNTLSSVLQFKQRDGNPNKLQGNVRLSSSEAALTLEGPLSKKTTFLASARRSYLQFLFQALDLPIRPSYWDFQYKIAHQINKKASLNIIGVGAIDDFYFGVPKNTDATKEYIIRSNPLIKQWNYTVGASLKYLLNNGYMNVALSRNMFDNDLDRYEDGNTKDIKLRVFNSQSQEIENKLRLDINKFKGKTEYSYGAVLQYVKYNNDFFNIFNREVKDGLGKVIQPLRQINFNTDINFFKSGLFFQASTSNMDDKLKLSGGLRSDMNSFTADGGNPLKTLSPRASASYQIADKWRINTSLGRYYKLPLYTVLGYKDNGNFVNKDNKYIQSDHFVAGLEFIPRPKTRITVEAFIKNYNNYPVSVARGISLANDGGDFGAIGNERTLSIGKGKTKGVELFFQQKLTKGLFGVLSLTVFESKFSGSNGNYISSAWNSGNIFSAQLGKKFNRGWEMGLKWQSQGGNPYTPYDLVASQKNYSIVGRGTLDNTKLNQDRLGAYKRFDFRLDKKWNFRKTTFDLYLDVQNAFVFANPTLPVFTFARNEANTDFKTTDGLPLKRDGSNGVPLILSDPSTLATPSIGFVWEF